MIAALTITFGGWIVPTVLTLIILGFMFRPTNAGSGMFSDLVYIFRAFWLIPLLLVWVVYLGVCLWLR